VPRRDPTQRAAADGEMETRSVERAVWLGLIAVVAIVVLVGLWSLRGRIRGHHPPVLGALPPFSLVERSGRPVSRADLAGRPWVADFIFTRCTGTCPALSARMAELGRALRQQHLRARLVSFSVDPTHDTPEVLREYAAHFTPDDGDWWFVTGDHEALYQLVGQGFRLSVAERSPGADESPGELITHSDRFVLVDGDGRIRGYYHGVDADAVPALVRDLEGLPGSRG
jgi:protein SCO1/2